MSNFLWCRVVAALAELHMIARKLVTSHFSEVNVSCMRNFSFSSSVFPMLLGQRVCNDRLLNFASSDPQLTGTSCGQIYSPNYSRSPTHAGSDPGGLKPPSKLYVMRNIFSTKY